MRRGWKIGVVAAGLLALVLWLLWPATAPESASRATRRPEGTQAGASVTRSRWSTVTPAGARGTLSVEGHVVGPLGPVPGALVVAFAPGAREWPSLNRHMGGGWPCQRILAAGPLLELAAELRGKQPPLARAITDAQGRFRLEGLEGGTVTLWAESGEEIGLRGEVAAGSGDVEVRLGPGMAFSGVVHDEEGRPVPGALVTTLQQDTGRFVETSTDEGGRFLLGPLPWGNYAPIVSKEGLVPALLDGLDWERRPSQVTLSTPRRLSGQVMDERGPVPGATVQFEGVAPVLTDARGRFSLGGLCPGHYRLMARHGERGAEVDVFLNTGLDRELVTLHLTPRVRLSGQVTDSSGQPLEGILVSLLQWEQQWRRWARTDPRGGFAFENLPPGTFTVTAQATHYEPSEESLRLLESSRALRFTLKQVDRRPVEQEGDTGSIEVEWVDARGRPVPRAVLQASLSGRSLPPVTTDLEGRAVLQELSPGSYQLVPQAPEGWIHYAPLSVTLHGAETRKVRIQSEEGWSLSGQVVDSEGKPLEGAFLRVSRVDEAGAPPPEEDPASGHLLRASARGLSGPDGRFTLANLPEGPCALEVSLRGYVLDVRASSGPGREEGAGGHLAVSPGSPDVRLVLRTGPRLRGRVVREDGTPIPSFQVERETVSHPEGRFSVPLWGGGMWSFSARGFSTVRREVSSREGRDVELGDVVLVADRTVRGRVLEAETSAPVAGAWVEVGPSTGGQSSFAFSQPDGSFTLEGVTAGADVVRVTHPNRASARVELAQGQREVTVVLVPEAVVEGRIASAGVPVSSGSVELRSEQGVLQASLGIAEGRYSFRGLAAGRYLVQVVARRGVGGAPLFPVQRVELSAGQVVTLDFTEQLDVTVVEVFAAERNLEVHLLPGSLPLMGPKNGLYSRIVGGFMGRQVREGVWRFPRVPTGSYTLFAMRRGEDTTEVHREELEVPAGGDFAFTLLPQWTSYAD